MKLRLVVCFLFLSSRICAWQIQDSAISKNLDEVVVTATRTPRLLGNVAIPVQVISAKTISQSGSLRLHDILSEQTGIAIVENFGKGIQVQGLSSEYTLILIDGEPLVGRTGGVFDLSRISVRNIRKIEIVKGPSSSLYGSEAMGGVINIITDRAGQNKKNLSLRLGSFNTVDGNFNFSKQWGNTDIVASSNYNSSRGYSLKPNSVQKTVEPYWRSLQQVSLHHRWNDHWKAGVGLRVNTTHIDNTITVQNGGVNILSKGFERTGEFNATPYLSYKRGDRFKSVLRGYVTGFDSKQELKVKSDLVEYDDQFKQLFMRIESQTDISLQKKGQLSLGGGFAREAVSSNRYDSLATQRSNSIAYLFAQHEVKIQKNWTSILGFRFDGNQTYASVLSPKLSLQYKPSSKINVTLSYGKGFKAPDFRQLYLNFTNLAAGAYSVFGTAVASTELNRLKQLGQLDQLTPMASRLSDLKPEISGGFNAGVHWQPQEKIKTSLNLFRNDLSNMILTDIVAFKRNGGQIFSYFNINRVLTQGIEWDASYALSSHLQVKAGYQFLYTADKDVLKSIRDGKLFQRSIQDGSVSRMRVSDYGGLPNRSAHQANVKVFYESSKGNFITLRALYRSRWGTVDADGNGLINRDDEYAQGFVQFNMSAGWMLMKNLKWMAGVDNLLNYKDELYLPGNPGRVFYMDLQFNF
ncbi:MAG: hypothetical protein RL131_1316 [Bacteroidota bacterium]